jgi:hypothetical protein
LQKTQDFFCSLRSENSATSIFSRKEFDGALDEIVTAPFSLGNERNTYTTVSNQSLSKDQFMEKSFHFAPALKCPE